MRGEANTVNCWRCILLLLAPLTGFISFSAAAENRQDFDIRRQSLSAALLDFSYQADIQIVMPGYLAEGRVSRKIKGAYSPSQVLDILLKGTGLEYEFIGPTTVTIRAEVVASESQAGRRRRSEDREMEQLFVTAEERRETLRDISISVATLTGEDLESRGITKADQLQEFVPGLTVGGAQIGNTEFSIRGIGVSSGSLMTRSGVGVYIDDVYIPRQGPANMALYELERVEVLRGPQATLYSHDAIGGALNYITQRPPESLEGRYLLDAGNKGQLNHIVTVGGGLARNFTAQLAVASFDRDPVMANRNPGEPDGNEVNSSAARANFRIAASDRLEWLASVDAEQTDHASVLYSLGPAEPFQFAPGLPLLPGSDPLRSADVNASTGEFLDIWGGMVRANYTADAYRASFIFGRRRHELGGRYDLDQSRDELVTEEIFESSRLESFEARFVSLSRKGKAVAGDVDWLGGVYFLKEIADAEKVYFAPGLNAGINRWRQDLQSKSYAAFGQITYWLNDRLRVVSGLRYIADFDALTLAADTTMPELDNPYLQEDFALRQQRDWRRLTPKIAINFDYSPDTSVYASVTTGFKAGGFIGTPGSRSMAGRFAPVRVENLEVGLYSQLFAKRMKVNLAMFSAKYHDLQISGEDLYGKEFVVNAEKTEIDGLELEVQARPSPSLKLSMGLSVIGARFDDFELPLNDESLDKKGDRVPRIPDATLNLSGIYYFPETSHGFYSLRTDLLYSEEAAGLGVEEAWPSFRSYNLWFDYLPNRGNWEISAWIRNVTDEAYFQSSSPGISAAQGAFARKLAPPRLFGFSFKRYW
ncbi:MAG TPA: TonB-dependent receptor [Gammaproteobacteria bacterium]